LGKEFVRVVEGRPFCGRRARKQAATGNGEARLSVIEAVSFRRHMPFLTLNLARIDGTTRAHTARYAITDQRHTADPATFSPAFPEKL